MYPNLKLNFKNGTRNHRKCPSKQICFLKIKKSFFLRPGEPKSSINKVHLLFNMQQCTLQQEFKFKLHIFSPMIWWCDNTSLNFFKNFFARLCEIVTKLIFFLCQELMPLGWIFLSSPLSGGQPLWDSKCSHVFVHVSIFLFFFQQVLIPYF